MQSKATINAPAHKVIPVDICADGCEAKLESALEGADALVIATSAVPQLVYLSLLPVPTLPTDYALHVLHGFGQRSPQT